MQDFKEQFKGFILNDIFWFDKSELNFGIYKIFRQKEQLIKDKLDEIVANIEKELDTKNSDLNELKEELLEYIPPKKAKNISLETFDEIEEVIKEFGNGDKNVLLDRLNGIKDQSNYNPTKVYEYLYQFFNLYYEKGDFGYTPRSFRTYTIPYTHKEHLINPQEKVACENSQDVEYSGEETLFSWKTKDSYYIKSNKFLNSVAINLEYKDTNYTINTNILAKDENIKDDKKVKQYRLISIKKNSNNIILNFNISDFATPKHTIYLALLSVIENDIKELNYDEIFNNKDLKEYFEVLPFNNKLSQTSLFDENQKLFIQSFKEFIQDENFIKYLLKRDKNIFKYELSGEEDKTQLKSKVSKLMLTKKEYASAIYSKTTAKEFLGLDKKEAFDLEDKKDLEKLYTADKTLNFFYRLDRGINLFYAGVDSDYFIHKNLKRFLIVELDKFIKNYIFADTDAILRWDETTRVVARFARVFKSQAMVFIDLLSSIEEFQKYLWNKRKMVKSANYIISSNKISDVDLLQEVLKNASQIKEWQKLGIIEIKKPNLIELQSYAYPIDTKHFEKENPTFKYRVLSLFDNLEKEIDGMLIKSENYQALRFLQPKYTTKKGEGKIKCIYIDPPYNTGNDGFIYKDNYKSASWLSMINDRLEVTRELMSDDGVIFTSIDTSKNNGIGTSENPYLNILFDLIFKRKNFVSILHWKKKKQPSFLSNIAGIMENIIVYAKNQDKIKKLSIESISDSNKPIINRDNQQKILNFKKGIRCKANISFIKKGIYRNKSMSIEFLDDITIEKGRTKNDFRVKAPFRTDQNNIDKFIQKDLIFITTNLGLRRDLTEDEKGKAKAITDLLLDWGQNQDADTVIKNLFNLSENTLFDNPKPCKLIQNIIKTNLSNMILDFFAGSGTTAHAVIELNKKEEQKRKFIVVEMNNYFDTIILPRVKKVSFATNWKNGKAQDKEGFSSIYQYLELESYDDIIDNLEVKQGVDYSKAPAEYNYEPDKNQINFRMDECLKNPLSNTNRFDILHSFIYHQGLELKKIDFSDDILVVSAVDKYGKDIKIILADNKAKVEKLVESFDDELIYSNFNLPKTMPIEAEDFKGI